MLFYFKTCFVGKSRFKRLFSFKRIFFFYQWSDRQGTRRKGFRNGVFHKDLFLLSAEIRRGYMVKDPRRKVFPYNNFLSVCCRRWNMPLVFLTFYKGLWNPRNPHFLGALRAPIFLCSTFVKSSESSKISRRASRANFPLYSLCKILEMLKGFSRRASRANFLCISFVFPL